MTYPEGRFACVLCGHDVALHNHTVGCPACTCAANRREAVYNPHVEEPYEGRILDAPETRSHYKTRPVYGETIHGRQADPQPLDAPPTERVSAVPVTPAEDRCEYTSESMSEPNPPTDAERQALRDAIVVGIGGMVGSYVPAYIMDRAVSQVLAAGFHRTITIEHEDGNTLTGTPEQVLNHGHLKPGWKVRP